MARGINRLSSLTVTRAKEPGLYADGGGLYLRVGPTGAKSWIYRYMANGRRHDMGLGALQALSLADARVKAAELRKQRTDRVDPLQVHQSERMAEKLEAAKAMTFRQCAERYIESHKAGWKNAKHAEQ